MVTQTLQPQHRITKTSFYEEKKKRNSWKRKINYHDLTEYIDYHDLTAYINLIKKIIIF